MDKLFIAILNNTLVASWIIFAVIVLRFVFKKFIKKIPKWVNCLLWGLVAIRLVFPFSIESIFSLIPSAKPVPVDIEYAKVPKINSGINVVNTAINPILENNFVAKEIASVNPIQIVIIVVSYLWIIGVIGLLVYAIISFLMLKSRVRNSQLIDKGIFRSENIDSPFILGLLRPCVYIPNFLEEEAYQCVIEHELAHIKRGDFIWKPMGFLILSVYWFNPLCWIAYICLCKDIEYACDEKVTRDKDKDWKALYCQVLLDCSSERRLISACPVAFGEVSVKDRIKSVINYKRPSFWIVCISIIVAIIVAICFLTNPKQKEIDRDSIVGKYVNDIAEEDKMLYASVISINEDGTFGFTPSLISSYMGAGIWEIDKDHIIFYDTGMGDTRKEVFQYNDGVLYYLASESATNSMWQLADGTQYTLAPEDYDLIKDALETNDDQNIADAATEKDATAVYYQLVHDIETAMYDSSLLESNPEVYKDSDGNSICSDEFLAHLYDGSDDIAYQNLGYLIKDIDGDGTEELLLGENDPNPDGGYNGIVYDLYTYRDGKLQHIFSGWSRNRYYLTNSNEIICEWSNASDDYGKIHYLYEDGSLTEMDGWEDVYSYYLPQFNAMGPIWIQVDDLNGDTRPDYVIRTGMDGYYNHLSLYLTGEGKVFEHEDDNVIEPGTMLCSIDIDHDGEREIALSMAPHVNSAGLMKYAVLKRTSNGWKELEIYNPENGDDSFPIEILHKGDYKNVISCQGLEKSIIFDVEYIRNHWENDTEISSDYKKEVLSYYDNIYKSVTGTPVGQVCDWGMWDINEATYKKDDCLQAQFGIAGYDKNDFWGYLSIYFDYDRTGKIRILDLVFDSIKAELPATTYVNPEGNGNEDDIVLLPLENEPIDLADENMGVSYREHPITHEYLVDGDMLLQYKKRLIGKKPGDKHSTQYIVLTNDENVTWEQVNRSLNSDNYENQIYGTIIIGIKEIAHARDDVNKETKVFWKG